MTATCYYNCCRGRCGRRTRWHEHRSTVAMRVWGLSVQLSVMTCSPSRLIQSTYGPSIRVCTLFVHCSYAPHVRDVRRATGSAADKCVEMMRNKRTQTTSCQQQTPHNTSNFFFNSIFLPFSTAVDCFFFTVSSIGCSLARPQNNAFGSLRSHGKAFMFISDSKHTTRFRSAPKEH